MPEMTWSQMRDAAKQQGFEPLPIGTYDMRVEQVKIVAGKGSQQIQVRLVVTTGPIAGRGTVNRLVPFKNDGEVNGMFFQQLAALGLPETDQIWQQIDQVGLEQGLGLIAQRINGAMCIADIDHQNYNGENRDNVKKMRPYQGVPSAGPGMTPMIPGQNVPYAPGPVPAQFPAAAPVPVGYGYPVVGSDVAVAPVQAPQAPQAPQAFTTFTAPAPEPAQTAPFQPVPAQPVPVVAPVQPEPVPAPPAPPAPAPYGPEEQPQQPGGVQPVAPVANPSI